MKTRRSVKRVSPSSSSKKNPESREIKTEIKKQKLENGTDLCEVDSKSSTNDTKQKPLNDDSSDSSSNEFTTPYTLSNFDFKDFEVKDEAVSPKADFSSIENNILTGVTRLSDSDETDFEDVEKPNLNILQVSPSKQENKSELQEKIDVQKPSRAGNKRKPVNKAVNEAKQPSRTRKKKETSSIKQAHIKAEGEKIIPAAEVDKMNVSELLAIGEASVSHSDKKYTGRKVKISKAASSEEENSDWEEVGEMEGISEKSIIPKEGVQVTLEIPSQYRKQKKKGFDWEAHVKRRLNRVRKEIQELMHKVHLLCWIAHGRFVNSLLNSDVLMGISLSLIPSQHCYPSNKVDLRYLEQIVKWFSKTIVLDTHEEETKTSVSLQASLEKQFQLKKAFSPRDMVLMFICILRGLGLKCRLVLSLLPVSLKPESSELCSISRKKKEQSSRKKKNSKKVNSPETSKNNFKTNVKEKSVNRAVSAKKNKDSKTSTNTVQKGDSRKDSPESEVKTAVTKSTSRTSKVGSMVDISTESTGTVRQILRKSKTAKNYKVDSDNSGEEIEKSVVNPKRWSLTMHETPSTLRNSEGEDKGKYLKRSVKAKISVNAIKGGKSIGVKKKVGATVDSENSDSDFEVEKLSQTSSKTELGDSISGSEFTPTSKEKRSSRVGQGEKLDRRVLSSDSNSSLPAHEKKKKKGFDVWTEVFVEDEEAWISVDVPHCKMHCTAKLFSQATQPVTYVLAFNNDLSLKDITRRYCPQFATATRKLRVDEKWWNQTLWPFCGHTTAQDKEEDEELNRALLDRPMPTLVADLKNHPLYVLKRHLLKFQAIYPPDAPPLGFVKGEPVYARECVHTLHSREIWLKEAKVVRLGEKPYKIVKARPKFDKMTGQVVKDLPLEIFGPWQVEDYIPPPAVDGKVPRNEYGNVELFKPCMLPKGTVHLHVPGLNRVARKLGIDCAPAVVGFDYHCGSSHPMFDGFVVCEEYKDAVMDAWNQEQDEAERRQKEKIEKRVYGNWRRIIKGLLIRERLNERYSFGEENKQGSSAPRKLNAPHPQPITVSRGKKPAPKKPTQKRVRKKPKMESSDETDSDEDSDKDWN